MLKVEVNYKSMTGNRTVEITKVYHLKALMYQGKINYVTVDGIITFNMREVLRILESNGKQAKNKKTKHEKCHYTRCTRCTYNDYIKMRPTNDGFLKGICPRCKAEYLGLIKEK